MKVNFKKWLVISILLFSLGIVLGLSNPSGEALVEEELAIMEELVAWLAALPPGLLALFILLKNWLALLISFAFSPLLLLSPVLTLTSNGLLLEVVASEVAQNTSPGYVLAGLLPHGIIEIPALIIAEAAALSFGTSIILAIFRKTSRAELFTSIKKNLKYLLLAMLLMIPAALIETFITPLFIQ